MKVVNVLGTEYEVVTSNKNRDKNLERADGYCDHSIKKCVIDTFISEPGSLANLDAYRKKVIRHELIHAFLFESGLGHESWAVNEEIVDWIAVQFPKMMKVFNEANAL